MSPTSTTTTVVARRVAGLRKVAARFAPETGTHAAATPEIITTTPAGKSLVAIDPVADTADKVTKTARQAAPNVTNIINDGRGTLGRADRTMRRMETRRTGFVVAFGVLGVRFPSVSRPTHE
ncbi:hypothetical protein LTR17_008621 [Elasticomyces elasticus]|nr:hypothetical protein LTR17_008621 [Elasticomyces elasticus]